MDAVVARVSLVGWLDAILFPSITVSVYQLEAMPLIVALGEECDL